MNGNGKLEWSDLFSIGSLVRECVRKTRLQIKRVKKDFGLDEDVDAKKSGTDGHWYLVSPEALEKISNIEGRIRNTVQDYSVDFPLVRGGRFVPDKTIKELIEKLENLKVEWNEEVQKLAANYESLRQEQIPRIISEIHNINPVATDETVNATIARINASALKAEDVPGKFDVSWTAFAFRAPINKEVAEMMESESESVNKSIGDLVTAVRDDLKKKVADLLVLIEKGSRRSFGLKSLNAGLRDCDRFEKQNVFDDEFVTTTVRKLRDLLMIMKSDIENGVSDEAKLGLTEIQDALQNEDVKAAAATVVKKLGKRKLF